MMTIIMKHSYNFIFLTTLFLAPLYSVQAEDFTVRPFLIDETVEARELLQRDVTLVNKTSRRLNIYATVNEISVDSSGEIKEFVSPIMTDRTNTVTSWAEIKRGRIEVEPGESVDVPLAFRIHPSAESGEYHVFIGFGSASKRYQVERAALNGELDGVIVKLTIDDKTTEYLRITSFVIDRFITGEADKSVEIKLENLGDTTVVPQGEIIFFNSNGEELDAISFNENQISVPSGEEVTINSEIPFEDQIGRFKANLTLQYGDKQKASLHDSTQFYMMPLYIIIFMLVVAILLTILIFILLTRALSARDEEVDGYDLPFMVRDGHEAEPKDHDIDLSKNE